LHSLIPDEVLTGSGNNIAGTARSRSYGVRPVADVIDGLIFKKDTQMNRRVFIALAVAAMAFSTSTASAGGGGSKTQYVRIKNTGTSPALVNAKNGAVSAAGGKTVSGNGVAQFTIKKGAANAFVQDQTAAVSQTLDFNFPKSQYVYLLAAADATTSTLTFSPPGKIF
jgi:hypothetical protein